MDAIFALLLDSMSEKNHIFDMDLLAETSSFSILHVLRRHKFPEQITMYLGEPP